jgi:hypothetical protein
MAQDGLAFHNAFFTIHSSDDCAIAANSDLQVFVGELIALRAGTLHAGERLRFVHRRGVEFSVDERTVQKLIERVGVLVFFRQISGFFE